MARPSTDSAATGGDGAGPRRAALQQGRSRDTRRRLIRAALELWNERGFERAVEDTTAEEIARAAGVSKGTFYFHFAHKEDILLEMPWATAEIMAEEAEQAMGRGEPTLELVDRVLNSLGRRVSRAPRAAVLRVTAHWSRLSNSGVPPDALRGFGEIFHRAVQYGIEREELPEAVDAVELATLLQAVTMDALVRWAATDQTAKDLTTTLSRRAEVVLRGAAAAWAGSG